MIYSLSKSRFSTAQHSVLTLEYPVERVALRMLAAAFVLVLCSYLYFVAASVLHVIARKDAVAQSARLTTAISTLEHRYFELSQSISPEAGAQFGLAPLTRSYVYLPGNAAMNAPAAQAGIFAHRTI